MKPIDTLEEVFHPKAVAIVGASANPDVRGYNFIRHLLDYGYRGSIYPINPNRPEILGIKAYPKLSDIPGLVSYVICCIPAPGIPEMLAECPRKGVGVVHLFTGRLGETGHRDAVALENEILREARWWGIRLIGPNCMGIYCPREGLSFGYDFPHEPGVVGAAFQSGGAATDLVRLAALRGLRFSKVVSYGNAIDLDESDFLDYFAQDPETRIVLGYVEGVKDGRRFFKALRNAAAVKPVIIIKGGRGEAGARATVSHTAALAGSVKVWRTAIAQAGAIAARNLDEMVDLAVSFNFLPPITGLRVGIAGGGGGKSVLSADECEETGLNVVPLPAAVREAVKVKAPLLWDWIGNPADVSITPGTGITTGDMLQLMAADPHFDVLIAGISEDKPFQKEEMMASLRDEVDSYIQVKRESQKPMLAVVAEKSVGLDDYDNWRWQLLYEFRTKLMAAGIPVYPSIGRAARSLRRLIDYYRARESEGRYPDRH